MKQAIEVRDDQERPRIDGYFARFDKPAAGLGFKETIRRGAFSKTIGENDVRALWNHNADFPLGRTKNGTLTLREDEQGLWAEISPPDTQIGRDVMTSIRRGDVDGASFAFEVVKDRWNSDFNERQLIEVRLFEVSPVVFPAYSSTKINARSIATASEKLDCDAETITRLIMKLSRGTALTTEDEEIIASLYEQYPNEEYEPEERKEPINDHSEPKPEAEPISDHSETPAAEVDPNKIQSANANVIAHARYIEMAEKLRNLGLRPK